MTQLDQKQLGKTLWAIADDLRGAMNADDFRDYMLAFLFLRYLSDNYEAAAKKELGDAYVPQASDDVALKMVEAGRLGRKNGKGWYDYPEGGKKHLSPQIGEMFPRALHQPDVEAVKERLLYRQLIDDEVEWAIYGPIDMFPFLGARRGKAAVLEVIRQIAENFRVHRFERETVLLGVDSAASMLRFTFTSLDSNKPVVLRLAHFAQFKAGRLARLRVLLDSFDLVEQALGRPIRVPAEVIAPFVAPE